MFVPCPGCRHLAFASLLIIIDVARTLYKLETRLPGTVSLPPSLPPPPSSSSSNVHRRSYRVYHPTLLFIPHSIFSLPSQNLPIATHAANVLPPFLASPTGRPRSPRYPPPTSPHDSPTTRQEEIVGVFKV